MTQPDPISHLANLIEKKTVFEASIALCHAFVQLRQGLPLWISIMIPPPPPPPSKKEINQQVTQLLDDSLWFQDRLWPTLTQHIEVL